MSHHRLQRIPVFPLRRGPGAAVATILAVVTLAAPPLLEGQTPPLPDTVIPVQGVEVEVFRRPLGAGNVPFAVSVVDGEAIQTGTSGLSLEEALRGMPGVQVQNRFNFAVGERVSIRGFGARSQFGIRGIRLLVDGIPATLPDGQSSLDHLDLGSLGRVEALRGPSSALYGNASGGVLAFRTAEPPLVPIRQEFGVVSGSNGYMRLQSSTSGHAGDVGYLLNLASMQYDGFRANPLDGASGTYGSAERLNLNARADRAVAGGRLMVTVNAVDLDAENPGSLALTALEDPDRPAWSGNVNQGTGKTVKQSQAGVTWTGPMGGFQGEFTAFGIQREVSNPIPGQVIDLDRNAVGGRALFRWDRPAGDAGTRLWVAGAELETQFDDRTNFRNQGGDRGELTLDQDERVVSTGVFLQTVAPFTPTFWAMGGVRYDRIHFQADDNFPRADGSNFSGDRDIQAVSPSLGLHWAASESTNLYMNVSTSFESPTTTELANRPDGSGGFNPDLEPQRGIGGEVGLRTTLGGGLGVELVGFATAVSNELVPFEDEAQPGRVFFRNAGSSLYNGAELVLHSTGAGPLEGRLTWSWTEARFREYLVGDQDFSDNLIPGQAPHRVEGLVTLRPGAGVRAELRGEWVDAIPVNDANTATSDSYTVVDLRLGSDPFRWNAWRITPTAGITNLLDQRYVASIAVNAFGGRFFEPGPGRSLHLGFTVGVERSP